MEHLKESRGEAVSKLDPQKHWEPYWVPAMLKPFEEQVEIQRAAVIELEENE